MPLPGPQTDAYNSKADIIGYGGAAGGGKTDLACGLAITKHKRSAIFRREATQLTGIVDRLTEIIGDRDGYNGSEKIWRLDGKQIEFGSAPHAGDEVKHQGRPKDLLVLDEAANFLEAQVRFLMGWVRTTDEEQKCTVLMTFNPPTSADGRWVISFFGPWLDPSHENPAKPGELRWFATVDGKDVEVDGPEPFEHNGEVIKPLSRTFIPSKIADNPYLMGTGYMATLQSMPEPLRSQMLKGDFMAGMEDDPWQVIPSEWVKLAQARWTPDNRDEMSAVGVDVARGGKDKTAIACRRGSWYAPIDTYPGSQTPNGPKVAALAVAAARDAAPIHVDVIGVGASVFDHLDQMTIQVVPVNGSSASRKTDRSGKLKFANKRAELYWLFREALDPEYGTPVALPPGNGVLADLTAPKWKLTARGIQVESKEDIIDRLGRSPDEGDAIVYAWIDTPKRLPGDDDYDDYRDDDRSDVGGY